MITVQATKRGAVGKTTTVAGAEISYVGTCGRCDIRYQKWTADYRSLNSRPWRFGKRSFATLDAAVKAFVNQGE